MEEEETNRTPAEIGEAKARRRKIGWWTAIVVGAVADDVFLYPVLLIFLYERTNSYSDLPEWVAGLVKISLAPLAWLHESVPLYETYTDWLEDLIV